MKRAFRPRYKPFRARFYVFARHIDNVRYVTVDDQSQFRTKEHAKSSLEVFHLVADKYFWCMCVRATLALLLGRCFK